VTTPRPLAVRTRSSARSITAPTGVLPAWIPRPDARPIRAVGSARAIASATRASCDA
jgi:hypothetical protein